jgi:hypothetical protein
LAGGPFDAFSDGRGVRGVHGADKSPGPDRRGPFLCQEYSFFGAKTEDKDVYAFPGKVQGRAATGTACTTILSTATGHISYLSISDDRVTTSDVY